MREKVDYMHIILRGGLLAMVCALLSVVWVMIRCFRQVSCRGNGSIWQKLLWELLSVGWCWPFSIIERGMIWGLIFIRSLFGVLLFWLLLRLFMA